MSTLPHYSFYVFTEVISHSIKLIFYQVPILLDCCHFSYISLQPEYLDWKPSEIDLRKHVVKKALSRWQEVCTYLGVTHEQVKAADTNNPRNVQQAFFESLMHWHSGCTTNPVNWESVLKALNASELTEVAKNIQTELGKYIC